MGDLKPCPFCGSEAIVTARRGKYGIFAFVQCQYCLVETRKKRIGGRDDDFDAPDLFDKYAVEELEAAWNTRYHNGE